MTHDADETYAPPRAYFPANSDIPVAQVAANPAQVAARWALDEVAREAAQLRHTMEHHVVGPAWLAEALERLGDAVAQAHAALAPHVAELERLDEDATRDQTAQAVTAALRHEGQGALELFLDDFVIYDNYFRVVRIPSLSLEQFAAQVAGTCRGVLRDLPFALLGVDEFASIVQAIRLMFEFLSDGFPADGEGSSAALTTQEPADSASEHDRWEQAWDRATTDADAWTRRTAFYRWLVGHHFFDLAAMFCRYYLLRARTTAAEGPPINDGEIVRSLDIAGDFLRATTAGMWYAGNFPLQTYVGYIRPTMEATGREGGFTGTQNADYKRMNDAKEQMKDALFGLYSNDAGQWPGPVIKALLGFHEIDIEDNEHHVLIAASKVGTDPSLAQKELQKEVPEDTRNAVDLLRDMVARKRGELRGRFVEPRSQG